MSRTYDLQATEMGERARFHAHLAEVLGFPAWYGRNLDALSDCLRDLAREAGGLTLRLHGVARLDTAAPDLALALAEVVADLNAEELACQGNCLITLLCLRLEA